MRVRRIGFVGTHSPTGDEMARFLADVIGLAPIAVGGSDARFFEAPNGDVFAVAAVAPDADEPPQRTIGFVVDDLDEAVGELAAAGIETDDLAENGRWRYVHFTAPDGMVYELVEERVQPS